MRGGVEGRETLETVLREVHQLTADLFAKGGGKAKGQEGVKAPKEARI